jgi:hypothetical protein
MMAQPISGYTLLKGRGTAGEAAALFGKGIEDLRLGLPVHAGDRPGYTRRRNRMPPAADWCLDRIRTTLRIVLPNAMHFGAGQVQK